FEPWMLQTGGELWRRLLTVLPEGQPLANVLMHLARLPPKALESLIRAVIEQPEWARELLARMEDERPAVKTKTRAAGDQRTAVKALLPMSFPFNERAKSRSRLVRWATNALGYGCALAFATILVRGCLKIFFMDAMDGYRKTVMAVMAAMWLACGA